MSSKLVFPFLKEECSDSRDASIVTGYKAAVRFEYLKNPEWLPFAWLGDSGVIQSLKGLAYQGRAKTKPTGNIDSALFAQMISAVIYRSYEADATWSFWSFGISFYEPLNLFCGGTI